MAKLEVFRIALPERHFLSQVSAPKNYEIGSADSVMYRSCKSQRKKKLLIQFVKIMRQNGLKWSRVSRPKSRFETPYEAISFLPSNRKIALILLASQWIMADLENGLFSGLSAGNNPADQSITDRFITAMVKGEPNQVGDPRARSSKWECRERVSNTSRQHPLKAFVNSRSIQNIQY